MGWFHSIVADNSRATSCFASRSRGHRHHRIQPQLRERRVEVHGRFRHPQLAGKYRSQPKAEFGDYLRGRHLRPGRHLDGDGGGAKISCDGIGSDRNRVHRGVPQSAQFDPGAAVRRRHGDINYQDINYRIISGANPAADEDDPVRPGFLAESIDNEATAAGSISLESDRSASRAR